MADIRLGTCSSDLLHFEFERLEDSIRLSLVNADESGSMQGSTDQNVLAFDALPGAPERSADALVQGAALIADVAHRKGGPSTLLDADGISGVVARAGHEDSLMHTSRRDRRPPLLRLAALVLFMAVFSRVALAGNTFVLPPAEALGLDPSVSPAEDGMRTDGGPGTVEWWYFDARFDDGSTAVVNVLTKPILKRGGPLHPKVEVTVTTPEGDTHRSFTFPSPADFAASPTGCNVTAGKTHIRGNLETYTIDAEGEGVAVHLTFTRQTPSWRPGGGQVFFDDTREHTLGWVVALPRADVRGSITADGRTWVVEGTGYHDHNWTNIRLQQVLARWIWGRAQLGEHTVLFFSGEGAHAWRDQRLDLFLLADAEDILVPDGRTLEIEHAGWVQPEEGPAWPSEVTLRAEASETRVVLRLSDPRFLEREDLLDSTPAFVHELLHSVMNPWYYRFSAVSSLEVERGGSVTRTSGEALYEWMVFGRGWPQRP